MAMGKVREGSLITLSLKGSREGGSLGGGEVHVLLEKRESSLGQGGRKKVARGKSLSPTIKGESLRGTRMLEVHTRGGGEV